MFKFEVSGLDEIKRNLKNLEQKAKDLDGEHKIPISELLTDDFISANSKFKTVSDLFDASDYKIESTEDFENIPDDEWDAFINDNTDFSSWQEMLNAAVVKWTSKKMGFSD